MALFSPCSDTGAISPRFLWFRHRANFGLKQAFCFFQVVFYRSRWQCCTSFLEIFFVATVGLGFSHWYLLPHFLLSYSLKSNLLLIEIQSQIIYFFFFTNVKASLNIHNMLHFSTLNVYKQLLLKRFDDGVMYPKCFLQCSYSEKCCSG